MSNPSNDLAIRVATQADTSRIAQIYNHYVEHTVVTFEEEPVAAQEIARRIEGVKSV
jgi:phosphinothricin acetyltransferase